MQSTVTADAFSRSIIVTSPTWATDELGERWIEPSSNNNEDDQGGLSSHNGTGQATFVTADDSSILTSRRITNPSLPATSPNSSGEANGTFKLNDSADAAAEKGSWTEAATRDLFTPSKLEQLFANAPPSASSLRLGASQALDNIAEESEIIDNSVHADMIDTAGLSPIQSKKRPLLRHLEDPDSIMTSTPKTNSHAKPALVRSVEASPTPRFLNDEQQSEISVPSNAKASKSPHCLDDEQQSEFSVPSVVGKRVREDDDHDGGSSVSAIRSPALSDDTPTDGIAPDAKSGYAFTFEVPKSSPSPSPSPTSADAAENQAAENDETQHHLRLFNTNFDTYTRQHLSAIVTELDVEDTADPPSRSSKRLRLGPLSPEWQRHFGRRRSSTEQVKSRGRLGLGAARRVSPQEANEMTTEDYMQQAEDLMKAIRGASSGSPSRDVGTSATESQDEQLPGNHGGSGSPEHSIHRQIFASNVQPSALHSSNSTISRTIGKALPNEAARAISTSTIASSGSATQSSANITKIMPDDIPNLPDTVGYMTFDKANMRWIRTRAAQSKPTNDEDSQESDDPFRSIESDERLAASPAQNSTLRAKPDVSVQRSKFTVSKERHRGLSSEQQRAKIAQILQSTGRTSQNTSHVRNRDLGSLSQEQANRSSRTQAETTANAHSLHSLSLRSNNDKSSPLKANAETPRKHSFTLDKQSPLKDAAIPSPVSSPVTPPSKGLHHALMQREPRSVSFADGRTAGKMLDLEHIDVSPIRRQRESSVSSAASADSQSIITSTPAPMSTRTRKINQAFDSLNNLGQQTMPTTPAPLRAISENFEFRGHGSMARSRANQTFLTECSFGVATDDIVRLITDIEPYEPNWEAMKELDITGKKVDNLVRLKEFLPNLETVKAGENSISYLTGLPSRVKNLCLARNKLTSLTSYRELHNLQILNVSGNNITSLVGLEVLPHLRDVNADDNSLTTCEGVMSLSALLRLSLKGNNITELKLSEWKTADLEVFNVSKNSIHTVTGVSSLQQLMLLNLDHNELRDFETIALMLKLKNLRLSSNKLTALDVKHLPNLRLLYVDENEISEIQNSHKAHKMDSFSMRDQRSGKHVEMSHFRDTRKVFMGGNDMPRFNLKIDFLALQYLELAMAQISILPKDMARRIPNVRTLNLCHNLLTDVTGLSGLERLTHLHLVSNRLSDVRKLSQVLETLPELSTIDVRANPMTSHLYPTIPINTEKASRNNLYNYAVNITSEDLETWAKLDIMYRRSLSDDWYVRRLAYRGVLMESQKNLKWIDGTKISAQERDKAVHVFETMMRKANLWSQLLG